MLTPVRKQAPAVTTRLRSPSVLRTALLALVASATLLTGLLAPLPRSLAADPLLPAPDGLSERTAAASCWEIKQNDPEAADGVYWLLTPSMTRAEQFYCDQTRAGGGWVLVGRGREGWSTSYQGSGSPAQVRAAVDGPAAFRPRQLSGELIEQLNDGGSIAALPDGIRLVRATDAQGTGRQEVRFTHDQRRTRWTWMFDSNQPVVSFSFDGTSRSGNGASTTNFGIDDGLRRVRVTTGSTEGWMMGFGFGSGVRGSTSSTSYLWSKDSSTGYARPFTQVFLRPKLMSEDLFTAIPDEGTAARTGIASADSFALPQPWGTAGLGAGPSSIEGSNEVSAFAESGGRVFTGGNFTRVQRTAGGAGAVQQAYLAAFDRDSGEFVPGFRPTFDNQVKAIAALPGGRIAVGGYFSTVNGEPHRGLVVLDATTGEVDSAFTGAVINALSGGVPVVRSLDVQDGYLYVGGSFTHSTGGSATSQVYTRGAARFAVGDGTPDGQWNPEFNGTVVSLDASERGDRVFFAGFFSRSRDREADKAAALSTSSVELYPWDVLFSNRDAGRTGYQQAVLESGDRVWLGGSEHSLMSYDRDALTVLSSSIGQKGGDFQALASDGNLVYGGCHCFDNQYEGATTWPSLGNGWTESHHIYGAGAWSASTGQRVPSFNGTFNTSRGAGAWALFVDSTGTLWQGGDYSYSTTQGYQRQWSGGFLRQQQRDTSAPSTPKDPSARLSVEGVTVSWTGSTDDRGVVGYQVLQEDRVVATVEGTTARLPVSPADSRYFVRAIDARGNASASTAVFTATGTAEEPEDPTSATLIEAGSDWEYLYDGTNPDAGWQDPGFDASSWTSGPAPQGWGQSSLGTTLTTTVTPKPLVSFHRHQFEIEDASVIEELQLTTRADDGIVLYVNGTEVLRHNVDDGPVNAGTYANKAVSAGTAVDNPLTVTVPGYLLTTGTNVITASVHSNYRSTPSHSFELEATAVLGTQPAPPAARAAGSEDEAPEDEPAAEEEPSEAPEDADAPASEKEPGADEEPSTEPSPGPEGEDAADQETESENPEPEAPAETEEPTAPEDAGPAPTAPEDAGPDATAPEDTATPDPDRTDTERVARIAPDPASGPLLLDEETEWSYSASGDAPPEGWTDAGFDDESWETGHGAIGWGHPDIDTPVDDEHADLPVTTYHRHTMTIEDVDELTSLDLTARADDGIVIYLNGEEIARSRLEDGEVTADTLATEDVVLTPGGDTQDLHVEIPGEALEEGENVLAVEVHSHDPSATSHSVAITAEENRR